MMTDFEAHMAEGKRLFFAGDHAKAAFYFGMAAGVEGNNPLPFAYRSWVVRRPDKDRALWDAEKAVSLDASCAEAHMSLALAHATGEPDFEAGSMALYEGRKHAPRDADGAVLSIGVYLIYLDALSTMREDAEGFTYEFKPTPLRDAADRLLTGDPAMAFNAFSAIERAGRHTAGVLGMAAACWAEGNRKNARTFAMHVLEAGGLTDPGLIAALRHIAG